MPASLFRPLPRPHAGRTLLCVSFAGGGTAAFRPWAEVLPPDVELALYCYPGREGRFTVPFAADWEELMRDALAAVRSLGERPYLLAGHSMGAWVAFDLARRLERSDEGDRPPSALIVSAAVSPALVAETRGISPSSGDSDEELLTWMGGVGQASSAVLAEPELRQMAVEVFRADLRVVDTYRHPAGATVAAPMQVLHGEEDVVDARAAESWRPLAKGPFAVDRLPGGHFYTPQVWARLPERLTALHTVRSG
ncbi:thioesterase II family protein [Streptomyces sindenensis]|uniref:Thioesterase II family protein n=1 Tax=Streptomyces sindenensis TaxID=67363 RepID=A0ABW6ER19_9ACTN